MEITIVIIILAVFLILGCLILLTKGRNNASNHLQELQQLQTAVQQTILQLGRELRTEMGTGLSQARQEQAHSFSEFQSAIAKQLTTAARTQNQQLDGFSVQFTHLQKGLSDTLSQQLTTLSETNAKRILEMRQLLDIQLSQLQTSNSQKLEEMRVIVDEKLQATLQERIGTSFKQVAERLEQVHKGLGEMQTLAQGVGDLKHILTNVKIRGNFGESQMQALLEQVLAPDQYQMAAVIKKTDTSTKDIADAVIKLPGKGDDEMVLLPIDSKFPTEDYERVLAAQEKADKAALNEATKALIRRINDEAKSISSKYIHPPITTDFAIMFLPSEGLYAEVLRQPGLVESLQKNHRVVLSGPVTLLATLSSLRMGFRTLAIEKRSSEVWSVLGTVKTEFGKFGTALEKIKNNTQKVLTSIEEVEIRNRVMSRALRGVETTPNIGGSTAAAPTSLDLDLSNPSTE